MPGLFHSHNLKTNGLADHSCEYEDIWEICWPSRVEENIELCLSYSFNSLDITTILNQKTELCMVVMLC